MIGSRWARSLVALGLLSCSSPGASEPIRAPGQLAEVPAYLAALQQSAAPDAYLIIELDGTSDFLQLTASPDIVELDLPLVTERQRSLEPAFRAVATELGLKVRDTRGSDGTRFLDVDLHVPAADSADEVQQFLAHLYGARAETPLVFVCHGC